MTDNTDKDQETRLRAIRDKGASDFYANKTEFNCPFQFGTAEYNEYERGWTQALKRAPADSSSWASSNWDLLPAPKLYEQPKVNEYARRKG